MPAWLLFVAAAIVALGISALFTLNRNDDARMERFGAWLAASLASQSLEPYLTGNLIHLGVIANRITELPEVTGTAVYTVEDRLLTSSGAVHRGRPFTAPLTHEDRIVGYVRLSLDEARFGLESPAGTLLLALFWALLVPAVLIGGRALLARHLPLTDPASFAGRFLRATHPTGWRRLADRPDARSPGAPSALEAPESIIAQEPEPRFLLVINLFNQLSLGPERRAAELAFAHRIADTVAELYNGRVRDLPGTGLMLAFAGNDNDDRPFHVVCAAFVLSHLLGGADSWGSYRIGVHATVADPSILPAPTDDAVTDTAVLSALARDETLVLSAALLSVMRYPQRLDGEPLAHPLLEELDTIGGGAYLARGLADPHAELIAQQVAEIGYAERSTARESTF